MVITPKVLLKNALCALLCVFPLLALFSCDGEKLPPSDEKKQVAQLYITSNDPDAISINAYTDCTLRLVDPNGEYSELNDLGGRIKVRGHSTSDGEKKPYNIKFSSTCSPLGLGKSKKFCLLANLFDKTLMRNKLSYDLASELDGCDYTPNTEYVDVYLNDVYLGNYLMTQPVGAGEEKVDINLKNNEFLLEHEPYNGYSNEKYITTPIFGILLGFNEPELPTDGQLKWLGEFLDKAETALQSGELELIEQYFDLDSFIDFYIVNELFKNVDFEVSSTRFYVKGGKLYAGPVWDLDLSSGNATELDGFYAEYHNTDSSGISTEGFYCRKLWYSELFKCDEFKKLFAARYSTLQPQLVNLYAENELGKSRIDRLLDTYGDSFNANYSVAGWDISKLYGQFETRFPADTFEGNVDILRSWLKERNEWILANLEK